MVEFADRVGFAVGSGDCQRAVLVEVESESAFVDEVVVVRADR